jgi:5-methylcytosine-specific restriction endonuclease McrA
MSLEANKPPLGPRRDYATFEHLVPRSKGGKSNFENVVLAHAGCNLKRGNSAATE